MSREKIDVYNSIKPAFTYALNRRYDITTHGKENLPNVPSIITPNHVRVEDSILVAARYSALTGRPLRFGAKKEYFDGEGIDDNAKYARSMKFLMEHTRMIPIDREDMTRQAFLELQAQVLDRLERGDSVALHPEGTRSDDGRLHKFKAGAALFAIRAAVPIIPVGLEYTDYSNGQKTHVDVKFGVPIMPEEYLSAPYSNFFGGKKAEHLIGEVERRVADLTGMAQSGIVAQLRKRRRQGTIEGSK